MKTNLLCLGLLLAAGSGTVMADDQVLNLIPSDATYINAGNADTNYSEAGVLYANFSKVSGGKLTDQLSAYGGTDITIVKFDASELPEDATITGASVTFNSQCTVSGKNSQLAIVPIGTDWSAAEATWNEVDLSANSSNVANLNYSNSGSATVQTYDAKNVLTADEDKVLAFAIFTNTGRQQQVTNLAMSITYTEEVLIEHSYTINAVADEIALKELKTGSAYENAEFGVSGLPYAIAKDGIVYVLDDSNVSGYAKSFVMGNDNAIETVSYAASDIDYFFEAESILSKSYGNASGAYSGGIAAGVYSGANLTMSNIAAGTYTITVNTYVRRANEDIFTVQVSANGSDWTDAGAITLTSNVAGNYSVEGVSLFGIGSIRLVEAKSQNQCHYVDYVTLTKTGEPSMNLNPAGYATFSAATDVTVMDAIAYKASVENDVIYLTALEGYIPAGTGVLLCGKENAQISFVAAEGEPADVSDNDLMPTTTATDPVVAMPAEGAVWALGASNEFLQYTGAAFKANRAYLVTESASAAPMHLEFVDSETAISKVKANASHNGKMMENGRIMIVKNGVKYNTLGEQVK